MPIWSPRGGCGAQGGEADLLTDVPGVLDRDKELIHAMDEQEAGR